MGEEADVDEDIFEEEDEPDKGRDRDTEGVD